MTAATIILMAGAMLAQNQDRLVTRGRVTLKGEVPKPAKVGCGCVAGMEVVDEAVGGNFAPRVIGALPTQKIVFANRDPHCISIHGLPQRSKEWNWCLKPEQGGDVAMEGPEMGVAVKCDIQAWMRATVHVMEHPYFAVTNGDGTFELPPLPPGEYTVEAWHETLGKLGPKVVKSGSRFAMEHERK